MNLTDKDTSQFELNILDRIGEIKTLDMYTLRSLFLQLIKTCFSDPSNFLVSMGNYPAGMLNYTYSDPLIDPTASKTNTMNIVGDYSFGDNAAKMEYFKANFKPAVMVCLSDFIIQSYNILNDAMDYKPDSATTVFTNNATSRVTFSCIGLSYAEAIVLAQVVSSYLLGTRQRFEHLFIKPYTISTVRAPLCINVQESRKMYQSDVILDVSFKYNWVSKIESPILKKVVITPKEL